MDRGVAVRKCEGIRDGGKGRETGVGYGTVYVEQ